MQLYPEIGQPVTGHRMVHGNCITLSREGLGEATWVLQASSDHVSRPTPSSENDHHRPTQQSFCNLLCQLLDFPHYFEGDTLISYEAKIKQWRSEKGPPGFSQVCFNNGFWIHCHSQDALQKCLMLIMKAGSSTPLKTYPRRELHREKACRMLVKPHCRHRLPTLLLESRQRWSPLPELEVLWQPRVHPSLRTHCEEALQKDSKPSCCMLSSCFKPTKEQKMGKYAIVQFGYKAAKIPKILKVSYRHWISSDSTVEYF